MTRAISGRPARGFPNKLSALPSAEQTPAYPLAYHAGKALHLAAKARGEQGYAAHWAGQGAPLARSLPAGELTELLALELRRSICRTELAPLRKRGTSLSKGYLPHAVTIQPGRSKTDSQKDSMRSSNVAVVHYTLEWMFRFWASPRSRKRY